MKISTILDQIDMGSMALPEFQRGYVWNREQVRGLMQSLYRRHPVGSLLVWLTRTESAQARGDGELSPGTVKLILDGQQRITSLYGIIRGCPPQFFDGNERSFTELYFHLLDETFQFYGPIKMQDDPLWVSATEIMQNGVSPVIKRMSAMEEAGVDTQLCIERAHTLASIKDVDLHVEEVTGADKTVDIVVDIFNMVNSGGTMLSKGDLALAKICAQWPQARDEMKNRLSKWRDAGFEFRLEWQLRCVNAVLTGEALFTALRDVSTQAFQQGLSTSEKCVDAILNMVSSRLGLDHDRVLGSRYSFPVIARYLDLRGGKPLDHRERDKLLYWYVHTFLWGRYAGSTESVLNQDLALLEEPEGALDRLINHLRQVRGDLRLQASDFWGWSRGTRFYPLLYMLTRVCRARDWGSGLELRSDLLGYMNTLELHHIFPKSLLYEHGYPRSEVNALANFTFLTKDTNLSVGGRPPAEYIPALESRHPGSVASHWIPMDPDLWQPERYLDFLEARRELLAHAANEFLDSLLAGAVPETRVGPELAERRVALAPDETDGEDEDQLVRECNAWVQSQGLPSGEQSHELVDEKTGEVLAVLDLAWPDGLQEGYSQPVAVLAEEDPELEKTANAAGFRFFTDTESFQAYVRRDILALELEV